MDKSIAARVSDNKDYKKLVSNTTRGRFDYKVYGLIDPRDNTLFYIGCTKSLIYFRVYDHFVNNKPCSKRDKLIKMLDDGVFPRVKVFYEFEDREYAHLVERYLINFISNNEFNFDLINIACTKKVKLKSK